MNQKIGLFLDDLRNISDVSGYDKLCIAWVVVRNYEEFVCEYQNGYDILSFDHDLGTEKTGYDCLLHVVEDVVVDSSPKPEVYFHTKNPVGLKNMTELWNSVDSMINRFKGK